MSQLIGVWTAIEGPGERWEFRADGTGSARFDGVMFGARAWDFRWRELAASRVQLDPVGGKTWIIDHEIVRRGDSLVLCARGRTGFWPSGSALRRTTPTQP